MSENYACTCNAFADSPCPVHPDAVDTINADARDVKAMLGAGEPASVDPLAALEAAERRLLEAGGWVRIHGDSDRWSHPDGSSECTMVAVTIARRMAKKSGASR